MTEAILSSTITISHKVHVSKHIRVENRMLSDEQFVIESLCYDPPGRRTAPLSKAKQLHLGIEM